LSGRAFGAPLNILLGIMKSMVTSEARDSGKQRYQELLALITRVIAEWDPYALFAGGAPRDEFDAEIARIATAVPHLESADEAASVVSRVFSPSFTPQSFTADACARVGQTLFTELQAHGFVA
jgi:hypothetical protein